MTGQPRSGPHQVLLLVYALFTLAAGARALVQLATDAGRAPVAYGLSLAAAVTYALGWVAIRRASVGRTAFASRMLWVELAGVLAVGTLSRVRPEWFPEPSVWSDYGIGYGFVPAALPVAGLVWLRRQCAADESGGVAENEPDRRLVPGPGRETGHTAPAGTMARMSSRVVTAFRVVALLEALSWLGLLVGMYLKYAPETTEAGVHVFGPIHGGVFVCYVLLALVTARVQRWSLGTTLLALVASVPPFLTAVFEVWAKRTGRLDPVTAGAAPAAGGPDRGRAPFVGTP